MANQDPTSGKWTTSSGTGSFDSRQQAMQWESVHGSNDSGGFGDGMADAIGKAAGGILGKIILFIPYLIAFIVGSLITLILKLGIVGKVILTALTIFVVYIFVYILAYTFSVGLINIRFTWLQEVLALIPAVLAGAWFWLRHYKVVKRFPWANYIALIFNSMKVFLMIPILFLVAYIVYYLLLIGALIDGTYSKVINNMAAPVAFGVAFLSAVAYWFIKLYKYREPISELPTPISDGMQRYSVGDLVWVPKKSGNKLYYAQIEDTTDISVKVVFYNGKKEEVNKDAVFYLDEAKQSDMNTHGNHKNGGVFYECKILQFNERSVQVKYKDDVEEDLPYSRLMFTK